MKERPILFSAPMVRAILDGRKTQTRRVMRIDQRDSHRTGFRRYINRADNQVWAEEFGGCYILSNLHCPFGVPGDRLWVREGWQQFFDDEMPTERPRGPIGTMGCPATPDRKSRVFYRADGEVHPVNQYGEPNWASSIHMPRWASRITLEVTGVRVERLQAISDADCEGEGVLPASEGDAADWRENESGWRRTYRQLWESINGPGSWDANPWVWVIEFRAAGGE